MQKMCPAYFILKDLNLIYQKAVHKVASKVQRLSEE